MRDARNEARAMVSRLIDAYNRKDPQAIADLYAEDVRLWSSLGEATEGKAAVAGHARDLFRRLPDERMTADTVVTDGDTVVVEFTSRGTTPAGEPYEIRFTEILEIEGGLLSDIKTYIDPNDIGEVGGE